MKNEVIRVGSYVFAAGRIPRRESMEGEAMKDIRHLHFPGLHEEDQDSARIKKEYFRQQGRITVENLRKNNFEAVYCDSIPEALEQVLKLVPDKGVVGFGDSHTIFALGLDQPLQDKGCLAIPHTCAVNKVAYDNRTPGFRILGDEEETREILRQYMTANVFLLGANAVTVDGQIVNIDGTGNRIAGSLYGADCVVVVAGANKIVKDLAAGLDRIRFAAAQMNNIKYGNQLACNLKGTCQECKSQERNCNITCILHKRPADSQFHVVIIGEELGF